MVLEMNKSVSILGVNDSVLAVIELFNASNVTITDCEVSTFFPRNLRQISHVADNVAFAIALSANMLLVGLILSERSRSLRAYSTVLLQNCFFDIFTTLASMITQMQIELMDGHVVYIINGPLARLPMHWYYMMTFLYTVSVCAAVNIIVVIFIFRYMLVCKGVSLRGRTLAVLIALPLFYAILECVVLTLSLASNGSNSSCAEILNNPIWWEPGTRQPPTKCAFTLTSNSLFIATMLLGVLGVSVIFDVMCASSFFVLRTLHRERSKFSDRTRQLQRQLNWMLFIQMFAPLFTCFFPALMLILSPLLHMSFPGTGLFVSAAFSWIPCVNPVVAILFVSSFRRRFLAFVLPRWFHYPIAEWSRPTVTVSSHFTH